MCTSRGLILSGNQWKTVSSNGHHGQIRSVTTITITTGMALVFCLYNQTMTVFTQYQKTKSYFWTRTLFIDVFEHTIYQVNEPVCCSILPHSFYFSIQKLTHIIKTDCALVISFSQDLKLCFKLKFLSFKLTNVCTTHLSYINCKCSSYVIWESHARWNKLMQ